jgi:hypothetical protein
VKSDSAGRRCAVVRAGSDLFQQRVRFVNQSQEVSSYHD